MQHWQAELNGTDQIQNEGECGKRYYHYDSKEKNKSLQQQNLSKMHICFISSADFEVPWLVLIKNKGGGMREAP